MDNAQGVKFCQQRQGYSYYRFNSTAGLWAWGDACAPSAEDAGTNLNNLCGGKYIYAGEAAMSSHPFVANTAGSPAFTYAVGENTGSYCYCRLTKPAIGPWVLFGNIVNQFTCANLCAWSLNSTNDVNMFLAMMP